MVSRVLSSKLLAKILKKYGLQKFEWAKRIRGSTFGWNLLFNDLIHNEL